METKPQETDVSTTKTTASRSPFFESIALVMLSLATVGTAWCSFEAAVWGGVSQRSMNLSAAASRRAVTAQLHSHQLTLLDVLLFSQYMNAHAGSNEPLARFYSDRFRGEAKTAFEMWMATKPFENPNAPPHPFVTNFYLINGGSARASRARRGASPRPSEHVESLDRQPQPIQSVWRGRSRGGGTAREARALPETDL